MPTSPAVRTAFRTALAAGAVVSLSACGLLTSYFGAGNVHEIAVGDCFNESEIQTAFSEGEVSDIPLVECSEPHDSEVFHTEDLPEGDFPGEASLEASLDEICTGSAFEGFVGIDYAESELYVSGLMPTSQTWEHFDDREILCYVLTEGEPVSESLEGANR
ncbi:septum formation family protein [Nocardiopsis terrae]